MQFDKRSWQQRNRVKTSNGELILTVPVISKNLFNQKINEVKIDHSTKFQKKMIRSISQNYSKTKYYKDYSTELFSILNFDYKNLIDLNLDLILFICKKIGINYKFSLSSELNIKSSKTELIQDICLAKKATTYVSTIGANDYLNDKNFEKIDVKLKFFNFSDKAYDQQYGQFLKNLSVIDLLFNVGPEAKNILKNYLLIK